MTMNTKLYNAETILNKQGSYINNFSLFEENIFGYIR